jgi:hypothetical protein
VIMGGFEKERCEVRRWRIGDVALGRRMTL